MKKQKRLWNLLTIMMVAMLNVGFVSCSNDDDDDKKKDEITLVGIWEFSRNTKDHYLLLTFSEDKVRFQEFDDGEWEEDKTYRYIYKNGILRITYDNGEERETIEVISLSKDKLVLKDWPDLGLNTFIRQ